MLVGDVHGQSGKLASLFRNLSSKLGRERFQAARVIFLGDLCDRGPNTSAVLSFVAGLSSTYPDMEVKLLAGNHDLAMSLFLGLVDHDSGGKVPDGWSNSRRREPPLWVDDTGGDAHVEMHLQGRRWGGSAEGVENAFNSEATFMSFGVAPGDRAGLLAAMPDSHKTLLSSLEFVVEIEGVVDDHNSEVDTILAVHAGLESDSPLEGQMAGLRRRLVDRKWLEPLQGRSNVLASPPDTPNNVLIVSGHHGMVKIEPNRVILDSCGGYDDRPLAALVFPERLLVEGE